MEWLLILSLLLAGVYVGWNIGANDTANCIGTTLGAGLLSFRKAVSLVATFAVLGALMQGHHVMETIGKGIVLEGIQALNVLVVLITAGSLVSIATFLAIPVSTTQAIVGGVLGMGLAVRGNVDGSKSALIVASWLICPLIAMLLAFLLTFLLRFILRRCGGATLVIQNALGWMAVASGCYVAYSMGANNVGDAVGPIANLDLFSPSFLVIIGGLAIGIGAITYGEKVALTVGKGITSLDIPGAFAAQVAAAFGIHLFSVWGIPVSTSSAVVGAVAGAGLIRGIHAIRGKALLVIMTGWIITPCLAALCSFLFYRMLDWFMS